MIILLTGTSSSGKSSIAREIMKQSQIPFLYYASDHILNFWMDSKFINTFYKDQKPNEWETEWFCRHQTVDKSGNEVSYINNGQRGQQLYSDLVKAACSLIDKGYDMVIDEVIRNIDQLYTYHSLLLDKKVYLIYICCENKELERREKERGDRSFGLWRSLLETGCKVINTYDIEVDTTHISPREGAKVILNFIENNSSPIAFKQLVASLPPSVRNITQA